MYEESHGTITIAQNVLNTIARLTTLHVRTVWPAWATVVD